MQTSDKSTEKTKAEKTTATLGLIVVIAVILLIIAVTVTFLMRNYVGGSADPEHCASEYLDNLPIVTSDGSRLFIDEEPSGEDGRLLYSLLKNTWRYDIEQVSRSGSSAVVSVDITCPNTTGMTDDVASRLKDELSLAVNSAAKKSDVYNADDSFRSEVLDEAYRKAISSACAAPSMITVNANLGMKKSLIGGWKITNEAVYTSTLDGRAAELKKQAEDRVGYISKVYIIPDGATAGNIPNPALFGETADKGVIAELLSRTYAKNLINGQTMVWNDSIELLEGTAVSYYLDESILMLQWQEKEAGIVGTFAEVFVSDGSQIRKKIAGDTFGDMHFEKASDFAKDVHAVLAVGGDFYNHGRNCGIVVQNRAIYRFEPATCDVCYIDSKGDMLFSYRNQFSQVSQAEEFVKNNDIQFSLSFGPVLIDNYEDKTPTSYAWGEINDTYARSALGMLGEHHYLTMNLNCGNGDTFGYATLRQAADAMIKRGCIKAYTLDGGQTATTVVNGVLKNPVQFGYEKEISDIIYFATSVPNE